MTDPNAPAFSRETCSKKFLEDHPEITPLEDRVTIGLSKRELFCAMAMVAIRAAQIRENMVYMTAATLARLALEDADVLIAELNREVKS